MKRIIKALCFLLMLTTAFSGCNNEPELPNGVYEYGEHQYYVIAISPDKIGDHFSLTGATGTLTTTYLGGDGEVSKFSSANIREVSEGGWVAWCEGLNKVIYIPAEYTEGAAQMIGRKIMDDPASSMSVQQAKSYISFLK